LGPDSALFRQVASGAHLAVLHLTRSYNEKTKKFAAALSVEEIRRVGRFLSMTSHDGSYRMVIVDPAEDMTISAANALLKRLEEPPERTLFMLVSHAPGRLLPTIRSRCQVVRLSPLGEAELTEVLAGIGMPLPGDAAARDDLLRRSAGSARRAILLSQFGGLDIMAAFDALMATPRLDVAGAHKLADVVAGRDQEIRFDLLNAHMLERLADAASDLARSGRNGLAARYSALSQDLRIAVDEADTYNLDRKQHALNMILRLHQNFRM
jgi:DNA polymerase-3 subunit delta'